jgi:competence protein ComEC
VRRPGVIGGVIWAVVIALVLLRAAVISLQPLALAPGDPARLLAANTAPPELALQGWLLADPRPSVDGGRCTALLQLPVGRTELQFSPCPDPAPQEGWQLRVWGRLRLPTPAAHPLLSGAAERLGQQQAASQLRVSEWQVLERPATPIADLRRHLAAALIERAGPERGGLLAALVLGSAVVPLPAEMRELFRASGLSHALAASGFHLSVLLGAVLPLARRLPQLPRLLLLGGAMGLFVLLAGPQPSVLRAVLMAAITTLALECGRRGRPLAVLFTSVGLLLLVWPRWLLSVGFQLSVVATAALVLSAGPLEQGMRRWLPDWCGPTLAPATAVPLAACLYTLPLQLLHFGVVPLCWPTCWRRPCSRRSPSARWCWPCWRCWCRRCWGCCCRPWLPWPDCCWQWRTWWPACRWPSGSWAGPALLWCCSWLRGCWHCCCLISPSVGGGSPRRRLPWRWRCTWPPCRPTSCCWCTKLAAICCWRATVAVRPW